MKISELIAALQERLQRHGDLEVEITWEGITQPVHNKNIYAVKQGTLHLDGDCNFYKDDNALDPSEGGDDGVRDYL